LNSHATGTPSDWVVRWTPLAAPQGTVLDVACGAGRHMAWFAEQGFRVTGIDRNPAAATAANAFGQVVVVDIENAAWPLLYKAMPLQFDVLVVTNYLWRALFPTLLASVKPGGVLLYETFALGNETVGKPSRPDFLLCPGELLQLCQGFRVVAFEDGFVDAPARFVQRIAAIAPGAPASQGVAPRRYPLSLKSTL